MWSLVVSHERPPILTDKNKEDMRMFIGTLPREVGRENIEGRCDHSALYTYMEFSKKKLKKIRIKEVLKCKYTIVT